MIRLNVLPLLERNGKTRYWLYKQLGMSYQNFSRMINNETNPSAMRISRPSACCSTAPPTTCSVSPMNKMPGPPATAGGPALFFSSDAA